MDSLIGVLMASIYEWGFSLMGMLPRPTLLVQLRHNGEGVVQLQALALQRNICLVTGPVRINFPVGAHFPESVNGVGHRARPQTASQERVGRAKIRDHLGDI